MRRVFLGGLGLLSVVALFGATAGFVAAQEDVFAEREAIMHRNGDAARTLGQMVQGRVPFDAAAAAAAGAMLREDAALIPDAWAENIPGGDDDTKSSPAIWEDKAAFDAIAADLGAAGAAVEAAAPQGLEAVAAAFGGVGASCQACHQQFRTQ